MMRSAFIGVLILFTTASSQTTAPSAYSNEEPSSTTQSERPTIHPESPEKSLGSDRPSRTTEPQTKPTISPLIDFITELHSVVSGNTDSSSVLTTVHDLLAAAENEDGLATTLGSILPNQGSVDIPALEAPPDYTTIRTSSSQASSHAATVSMDSLQPTASPIESLGPNQEDFELHDEVEGDSSLNQQEVSHQSLSNSPESPVLDKGDLGLSQQELAYQMFSYALSNSTDSSILKLQIDDDPNGELSQDYEDLPQPNYEAHWPGLFQDRDAEEYVQRPPSPPEAEYNNLPFHIPYNKEPYLPTKSPIEEEEQRSGEEGIIIYIPPGAFMPNIYIGKPMPYHRSVFLGEPTVPAPVGYPLLSALMFWSKNLSSWLVRLTGVAVILLALYRVTMRILGYENSPRRRQAAPADDDEALDDATSLFFQALNSQQFL